MTSTLLKKIVILGPESTGKSTLSAQLAEYYHASWCPEYAREYLTKNGPEYTYDDLLVIAKGQLALEDHCSEKAVSHAQATGMPLLLFIDTDMYVMKVWCEFVFQRCHLYILNEIATRSYDLFLLCKPDLPWTDDPLREYPDETMRTKLFHYYRDLLINQNKPWTEISGIGPQRLEHAIAAVNKIL